jgi:hypothetical protein
MPPLRLVGVGTSPYTRKLRAALRFRRIPYRFVIVGSREAEALPKPPLPLMPCLVVLGPDGEPSDALSDTTPTGSISRRIMRRIGVCSRKSVASTRLS